MPPKSTTQFQYRDIREKTFLEGVKIPSTKGVKKWVHKEPSVNALVDNGFYYSPTKRYPSQVTCFWCGKKENDLVNIKHLANHHLRSSPNCFYALIQAHMENYVLDQDKETFWHRLAKTEDAPNSVTNPHCEESINLRASTFKNFWPLDSNQKASANSRALAAAGLYYSPLFPGNDRLLCMYCDCPLEHWDADDDPLEEHKKNAFAYCYYLETLEKGNQAEEESGKRKESLSTEHLSENLELSERNTNLEEKPMQNTRSALEQSKNDSIDDSIEAPAWPSQSNSPKVTTQQASEFDAYDISIEEMDRSDENTIFKQKTAIDKKLPRRTRRTTALKNEKKQESKPKPQEIKQASSLKAQVKKDNFEDAHEDDREYDHTPSSRILLQALGEDVTDDSIVQTSSLNDNGSEYTDEQSVNDGSEADSDWVEQSDRAQNNDSSLSTKRKSLSNQESDTKRRRTENEGMRSTTGTNTDTSDFGMDSDRFREIINSPKKLKNMKKLVPEGAGESPSGAIFDISGHNIGDYNESDVTYFEHSDNKNGVGKLQSTMRQSEDAKRSAFDDDDDDDDFNFFSLRQTRKRAFGDLNEDKPEKASDSLKKNETEEAISDISASSDIKAELDKRRGGSLLNKEAAEKTKNETSSPSPEDHPNNIAENIDGALKEEPLHHSERSSLGGDDIDSLANDTGDLSGPETKPKEDFHNGRTLVPHSPIVGGPQDGTNSLQGHHREEHPLNQTDIGGAEPKVSSQSPNLSTLAKENQEESGDSKAPIDQISTNDANPPNTIQQAPEPNLALVKYEDQQPSSPVKESGEDSYQITLSPSSYGEYVKDLKSMDEEFVDASDIVPAANLQISQASKQPRQSMLPHKNILEDSEINLSGELSPVRAVVKSAPQKSPSNQIVPYSGAEKDTHKPISAFEEPKELEGEGPDGSDQDEPDHEHEQTSNNMSESHGNYEDNGSEVTYELSPAKRSTIENSIQDQSSHDNYSAENDSEDDEREETKHESMHRDESWSRSEDESREFFDTIAEETIEMRSPIKDKRTKQENENLVSENGNPERSRIEDSHSEIPMLLLSKKHTQKSDSEPANVHAEGLEENVKLEDPANELKSLEDRRSFTENESSANIRRSSYKKDSPHGRISGSFANVDASTPQRSFFQTPENQSLPENTTSETNKTRTNGEPSLKQGFSNIAEEIQTLKDTMEYLSEILSCNVELHNDTEGTLTDFVAAMPEEEETMCIKDWMHHNAITCGRTVREIATHYIEAYEQRFDKLIDQIELLPTTD